MIPINYNPLGVEESNPYMPEEVLCNIKNGESLTIDFYIGIYYIRGQGAGGGGGRNGYFGNGQGGGSGAGFEGYIRFKKLIPDVTVSAGVGGTEAYNGNPGTASIIQNIISLGGGLGGAGENNTHIANAGIYSYTESNYYEIFNYTAKNGNQGLEATSDGNFVSGGNSVLTNSGGGKGSSAATEPGAGGGGGYQWHTNGGDGMYGELLIRYIGQTM